MKNFLQQIPHYFIQNDISFESCLRLSIVNYKNQK